MRGGVSMGKGTMFTFIDISHGICNSVVLLYLHRNCELTI